MYVGSEDNHRMSHLIYVTVSSGCRAAGAWSIHTPPYFVSSRIRWALPPHPLYTFMAWWLGTGSNRANWAQFVCGMCLLQISARTPISLQAFSLFYSVPPGIWRDIASKLSRDHSQPPYLQVTIHDSIIWLRHWINTVKETTLPELLTLLPRGSVKVTCIFVRLYSCPVTEEQSYGTTSKQCSGWTVCWVVWFMHRFVSVVYCFMCVSKLNTELAGHCLQRGVKGGNHIHVEYTCCSGICTEVLRCVWSVRHVKSTWYRRLR
jgi:hypothetical protein